jgi:hypothetical protein
MFGTMVQVIMAISLVIILFVVAFAIYNMELVNAIKESGKVRRQVPIFKGIKDLVRSQDVFNTINPTAPSFRDLSESVNQTSGGEYTYNFWMYMDNTDGAVLPIPPQSVLEQTPDRGLKGFVNNANVNLSNAERPFVLLLRGDPTPTWFKGPCFNARSPKTLKMDVMVKSPMITLERGGDVLSININTLNIPDGVKERAHNVCDEVSTDWEFMNSYRLAVKGLVDREGLHKNWFMVTVVVQDTYPSDPIPIRNKVRVRVYFNGVLELDRYVDGRLGVNRNPTVLRQNKGHLYIAPVIKEGSTALSLDLATGATPDKQDKLLMADLTYFNYAVEHKDINAMFKSGFTKSIAPSISDMDAGGIMSLTNNMSFQTSKPILSELKAQN